MRLAGYFDHAASSPLNEVCKASFARFDAEDWAGANPNSLHGAGRQAFACLESCRGRMARLVGARRPSEIVFTSGGTESNNIAVCGMARAMFERSRGVRRRVLVSAFEHDSVLDAARELARDGRFSVETIPVLRNGTLDLEALDGLLGPDVALVSVMAANNEIGTVQPLSDVAQRSHAMGALVHTDAVQAFGHIPFHAADLGVDAASFAAHKLGGPVGVGALYVASRVPISPLSVGGGQEGGLRPGTQDVRSIKAYADVAQDACLHLEERSVVMRSLASHLVEQCCTGESPIALTTIDGPRDGRFLPGVVHLLVPGHQTEGLVLALDEFGFAVSGGSACSSSSLEPSHVLSAIGIPRDLAFCALRISFDHRTTRAACDGLAQALREVCAAGDRRTSGRR